MGVFAESVELTGAELDAEIRSTELAHRQLVARQAMLIAVAEARQVHAADGHRSMAAYLRATCNWSGGEIAQMRKLGRLFDDVALVGEALVGSHRCRSGERDRAGACQPADWSPDLGDRTGVGRAGRRCSACSTNTGAITEVR